MTPQKNAFLKGLLGSLPILIALAGFIMSMDGISQWAARTNRHWANFQGLLVILFCSSLLTLVGLVVAVLFFWGRSRWTAYGILSSVAVLVLLGVGYFLILISGMPRHD